MQRYDRITSSEVEKPRGYLYNKVREKSKNINYDLVKTNLDKIISDDDFNLDEWLSAISQWEPVSYKANHDGRCPCSQKIHYVHPIKNKYNNNILFMGIDCIDLFNGVIKEYYKLVKYINDKIEKGEFDFRAKKIYRLKTIVTDINYRETGFRHDLSEYEVIKRCLKYRPEKFKENWSSYKIDKYNMLKNKELRFGKHKGIKYSKRTEYINWLVENNKTDSEDLKLFYSLHKQIKNKL